MIHLSKFKAFRNLCFAVLLFVSVTAGGYRPGLAKSSASASPDAASLNADFAAQWMQLVYDHVLAQTVSAPDAARVYAYAGVTLYEAVVPGIPNDVSLSTQLKGMAALPVPDAKIIYDWPTVANGALAVVVPGLIPDDATAQAVTELHDQQVRDRKAAGITAEVLTRSLDQGAAVGKALADWIAQDNFQTAHGKTYTLPTGGQWDYVVTTVGTKAVEPYWGTMRPFVLSQSNACNVALDMTPSSDVTSTFYAQAIEVKTVGDHLTDEQKAIANFWVDTPGLTGAPSGHWVSIENQLVKRLSLKLDRAAEMYALVGMALGDAFISCWELKYEAPLLRPITYINRYISPTWKPYIVTPPFPTYPSGHSVASSAAATVLTALFGQVAFTDSTHVARKLPARSFTSFEAASAEAAISRLYGGIHFRVDIENGVAQGRCVGQVVNTQIHLHAGH